VIFKIM